MKYLLQNISANADGIGIPMDGGSKVLSIWATSFGGGTITIQASPDGGSTWITLTLNGSAATFTSNAIRVVDRLGQGDQLRATLTGATNPSGVYVKIS